MIRRVCVICANQPEGRFRYPANAGRGLCNSHWQAAQKLGLLDEFPLLRTGGGVRGLEVQDFLKKRKAVKP